MPSDSQALSGLCRTRRYVTLAPTTCSPPRTSLRAPAPRTEKVDRVDCAGPPLRVTADPDGAVLPRPCWSRARCSTRLTCALWSASGPEVELDFEAAVRSVRPRLHRYATRRLGDEHEAEELVQEALLRAYSHRDKLRTEEDLAAWSTVVTGRLVIDRLRVRNRSVTVAEVPEGVRVGRDTADVVVGRDEARTALDALDAMPARQAALLWAREVEGDSYEDLCARFGMTEPAVRSILTRARKSLRKEYASRGGTLPGRRPRRSSRPGSPASPGPTGPASWRTG